MRIRSIAAAVAFILLIQTWTMSAVALAAAGGPVILSTYPGNNDMMVPANAALTIQFDENVNRTSVAGSTASIGIYQRSDNKLVDSFLARTDSRLSFSGSKLTIRPSAGKLVPSQDYYVLIDNGAIYSSNGAFAGISNATVWTFSTIAADGVAPQLSAMLPTSGAIGIDSRDPLVLNFSEPVAPAEGNIRIVRNDGTNEEQLIPVLSSAVKGAGTTQITVQPPTRMAPGKKHYVLIDNGAFVDLVGNRYSGISNANAWTFTTAPSPVVPPVFTPATGTMNADATGLTIKMQFSAGVAPGSGNFVIKRLSDNAIIQTIPVTHAAVSISGNQVSVSVGQLAHNTSYYVLVEAGALVVGSMEYEGVTEASTWYFTTDQSSSAANPVVSAFTPSTNGKLASITGSLSIKFNEPVFPDSGAITIRNANGTLFCSIPVTSVNVTGGGTNTITIQPCASFVNNSAYSVQISSLAFRNAANKYYAGIASTNTTSWEFTVTQDRAFPDLVSEYPATDAKDVRTVGLVLSATFDKPVMVKPGAEAGLYLKSNPTTASIPLALKVDKSDPKKVLFVPDANLSPSTQYSVRIPADAITDLVGNAYQGILNDYRWTFRTIASSNAAPQMKSGALGANSIILTYDQELDRRYVPAAANYYVTVNGVARSVSSVTVSVNQVTLNLKPGTLAGTTVKVSYSSGQLRNLNGVLASDLNGKDISTSTDTALPVITGGAASGSTVTLNYNKSLGKLANSTSAISQFIVRVNGSSMYPTAVSISGSSVILTLPYSVQGTDEITVTYTPSTSPITDASGNRAAALSNYRLTGLSDRIPPVLTSAYAFNDKIYLNYNEVLKTSSVPPVSSFYVYTNGAAAVITSVSVSGSSVVLTLAQNVTTGSLITTSYTPGYYSISDLAGNAAAGFAGYNVMNDGTSYGTSSQLLGANIQGSLLTLAFNSALNMNSIPLTSQFYVKSNSYYVGVTNVSVTGSTVYLTLSSDVSTSQSVTVTYLVTGNPLLDLTGQQVAAFTDYPVINGSSPIGSLPGYLEMDVGAGLKLNSQGVTSGWGQLADGRNVMKYTVDADKLVGAFNQLKSVIGKVSQPEIAVAVPSTSSAAVIAVPVRAFIDALGQISNAVFRVDFGNLQMRFPISSINYSLELQKMDVIASIATLEFTIENAASDSQLTARLRSQGFTLLASPAKFAATIVSGSQQNEIREFETYAKRTFILNVNVTQNKEELAVIRYDEAMNEITYVPTALEQLDGGKQALHFMRKGNGIVAAVSKKISIYSDMTNHWARDDVAYLASKLIVDGPSPNSFEPERSITRAEFARFIAKGLGLTGDRDEASKFKDVGAVNASAAYIGAASKAGIVFGGTDGNFRPNATITREDMAAMMQRAMNYAERRGSDSTGSLSKFSDRGQISSYAASSVAACVDAGIISGMTVSTFAPKENATRAQAAAMIYRFLDYVDFLP